MSKAMTDAVRRNDRAIVNAERAMESLARELNDVADAARRDEDKASQSLSQSFTNPADSDAYARKQQGLGRRIVMRQVTSNFADIDFTLYVVLVYGSAAR